MSQFGPYKPGDPRHERRLRVLQLKAQRHSHKCIAEMTGMSASGVDHIVNSNAAGKRFSNLKQLAKEAGLIRVS